MILYVLVGFLLVLYLSVIGKNVRMLFKPFENLDSFLAGLFYTLITYGILFHFTKYTYGLNYKVIFIGYVSINLIASIYISYKRKTFGKIDWQIYPSIIILLILLLLNTKFWGYVPHLSTDYVSLYWKLIHQGSTFIGGDISNVSNNYIYYFSDFYKFLGNFVGMFYELESEYIFGQQMYSYGVVGFIFTSAVILSASKEILRLTPIKNKWIILSVISPIIFQANPYFVNSMGSRMMIIPTIIIFSDVYRGKLNYNKWCVMLFAWMMWTSSAMFLIPVILLLSLMYMKRMSWKNIGLLLLSILPIAIAASIIKGSHYLHIVIFGIIMYVILFDKITKLNNIVIKLLSIKPMTLLMILVPLSLIIVDIKFPHINKGSEEILLYNIKRTLFICIVYINLWLMGKRNENVFKFLLSSMIFVNGIVLMAIVLFVDSFRVAAHRINLFIFIDDSDTLSNTIYIAGLLTIMNLIIIFNNKSKLINKLFKK